jgi:hypothetical protein
MAVAGGQLHNLGICPFKLSSLEPFTREQLREEGQSLMLGVGAFVVTRHAAHTARVQCKAGIKCLSCTAKQEGPTQVAQKCGQEFHMVVHNRSGKTWAVFRALLRGICCTQECTKCRNQASVRGCTNPTTSHISFDD